MAIPAQRPQALEQSEWRLRPVLLLIGFTATVAQVLLMRELLVVFYGNEISLGLFLASWLLWTSIGSSLFGRPAAWFGDSRYPMAGLQTLLAMTLPLTILAVRSAKGIFITVPGEMLGPWPMLLTALVVSVPFLPDLGRSVLCRQSHGSARDCGCGGKRHRIRVPSGSDWIGHRRRERQPGAGASVHIIPSRTRRRNVELVGGREPDRSQAVVAEIGVWRGVSGVRRRGDSLRRTALETLSVGRLWRGYHLLDSRNSAYGNLAVVQTENSRTLLENGLVVFTVPDPEAAEEAVHYALLQHPAPGSILLIGGGLNGSVAEALNHSSVERVDVVELDPRSLRLGRFILPIRWPCCNTTRACVCTSTMAVYS